MDTVPDLPSADNCAAPASNARTPGDWRFPIHTALDTLQVARKRLHHLQTDAACGVTIDPAELAAAAAEYESAGHAYTFARADAAESLVGLFRVAQVDPVHADTLAAEIAKLAGVPALEQLIVYLARRLDSAEKRLDDALGRIAELEDDAARNSWDHSDHDEPAGRSEVNA